MSEEKFVVGLTGGIGSGKSAAAKLFQDLGIAIIDADIAARKVVEPGQQALTALVNHFGQQILTSQDSSTASLDRAKLRSIVFSDPVELTWLNNFMHPLIRDWMDSQSALATSAYIIKVIPLLTESELKQQVDRVLVIDVPVETQLSRVSLRDNCTTEEVQAIINNQSSREKRLANCDDVISNNSSLADLEVAVKQKHSQYLELIENHR